MPIAVQVTRAAAARKPAHGAACNRCGLCCEVSVCALFAQAILGMPPAAPTDVALEQLPPGPCPALRRGPTGEASCGLVSNPEHWMPVRAYAVGKQAMSEAARLLIGGGDGCDCRTGGEPNNDVFDQHLARLDVLRAVPIRRARKLWRIA